MMSGLKLTVVGLAMAVAGCAGSGSGSGAAAPSRPEAARNPHPAAMEAAASSGSSVVGRPAPDFALVDQDERPVHLSAQRGKWVVLYFYPADDTPGCTCQATEFTDLLSRFHEMNAVVLGVSPDSPADHRFFRQKYSIRITLLSDPQHEAMRPYGAWVDTPVAGRPAGRVIRSTFLIDPQGRIAWHWPEVIPKGHAQRVGEKLAELAASR